MRRRTVASCLSRREGPTSGEWSSPEATFASKSSLGRAEDYGALDIRTQKRGCSRWSFLYDSTEAEAVCGHPPTDPVSRVTDIAPKTKGKMHSTPSLDFLVVHKGKVTLYLDSGEKAVINEGEAIGMSSTRGGVRRREARRGFH